mgnify:FL=1|jgi:hypothetical protein
MVNRASARQQIMKPGNKRWIQKAKIKKGALRKQLGVKKGKKISMAQLNKASKSSNPTTRRRANLAKTFKRMKRRS